MHERFSSWNLLPPHLASRFGASFEPLGCLHPPIQQFANVIADTAAAYGAPNAPTLVPVIISIVAATHAQQRLSCPSFALPNDEKDKPPSSAEWTLLAALECARSSLSAPITAAICTIVSALDESNRPRPDNPSLDFDKPAMDYGLGILLPAVTNQREWAEPGRAIGNLVRLLAEIRAIFDPKTIAPLPLLIQRAAQDVDLGSRASYVIACAAKPRPDKLPLASLFGQAHVRERIGELVSQWVHRASPIWSDPRTKPLQSFVEATAEAITTKIAEARIFGLIPAKHPPVAELHRAIDLARSALEFDPNAQSAWEVQRWGDWASEPRIGRVFPVGLGLLALCRAGHEADERIEWMIERTRRADGWRYYENYTDIPPDTDDLGLILRLYAALRKPRIEKTIFQRPFDLVRLAFAKDEEFPVWLDVGLDEPLSKDAPNWLGPRCIAVAAQFVLGLVEAKIEGQDDLRAKVLEWILDTWENHKEFAIFHYTWPFARLLLAKLIHALNVYQIPDFSERFQTLAKQLVHEIQANGQADGGWGSPLATACHIAILAMHAPSFDPWPSLTYLASWQGPDGMWPAEPLYRCPGKDGAPRAHGAAIITTGICLDALLELRDRLGRI